MNERINRLANGQVEYDLPKPRLSHLKIEEKIQEGLPAKGEFEVYSQNEKPLKGLVYSTNYRVQVVHHAFGGKKNRIQYEVTTASLQLVSEIKGSFYLVTNGGELELPYCFEVDKPAAGGLSELQTVQDFADVAFQNLDAALRLFEYSGFIKAPFLQELTLRSLYESLQGKGERYHSLEEFLVGAAVKDPVEIDVDRKDWKLNTGDEGQHSLQIKKSTWGYVKVHITTDVEFIRVARHTVQAEDFSGNVCHVTFQIEESRLHRGRNFGMIRLETPTQAIDIKVMVVDSGLSDESVAARKDFQYTYKRYLELRLDFESGRYQESLLLGKMQTELEHLLRLKNTNLTALFLAEVYLLSGRRELALAILEDRGPSIQEERIEELDNYCYYQYLMIQIPGRESGKDSLIRLFRKYYDEMPERFYLFLLMLKLEPSIVGDRANLFVRMKQLYRSGCSSPFLYLKACECLEQEFELLHSLGSFELQALHFGMRRGIIGEELAVRVAELAVLEKSCKKISLQVLIAAYEKYPRPEILEGICSLLIKGSLRAKELFPWFVKGLEAGLRLTRLYEYYLYTLPYDYDRMLPMELLLYFSYSHALDHESRELLYCNILQFVDSHEPIYQAYERQMEDFALTCLFEARINDRMALIYRHIIYRDIIDEKIAQVFPALLRSHRIECDAPFIKSVVVCYEELKDDLIVPVVHNKAYVPMYAENCLILFQDAYGNRYIEVDYRISRLMKEPELEERCFEIYPEHIMLQLKACRAAMAEPELSAEHVRVLEHVLSKNILNDLYAARLVTKLIRYYGASPDEEAGSLLVKIDKSLLSPEDRILACEALINRGHNYPAYEMLEAYGWEMIRTSYLQTLCSKMILEQLFEANDLLLAISFQVFSEGQADQVILDYLCEHFSGTVEDMYQIITAAREAQAGTYQMEERLLGQILFTGSTGYLDEVFNWYLEKKQVKETLVKAYFTMKSYQYVLTGQVPDEDIFKYMEELVADDPGFGKTAPVWQIALIKYYAAKPSLDENQQYLCSEITKLMLEKNLIFSFMQKLERYISLPAKLRDQVIVECSAAKNGKILIRMRVLPEQQEFHVEGMRHVYEGIYIKQLLLFDGEILEYEVYEEKPDGEQILQSGKKTNSELVKGSRANTAKNRFTMLNDIALCIEMGDETAATKTMLGYKIMDETVERLFGRTMLEV